MSLRVLSRATWVLGGAAWLSIASFAGVASAAAAPAAADSFPNGPDVILWPAQPCVESEVRLYVRGYQSTPCDSFLGAFRSGEREVTIRTLQWSDRRCAVAPSIFYAVPISFGLLPGGSQTITIHRHLISAEGMGILDSTVTDTAVAFTVADTCPAPPPPMPASELPYVDRIVTVPSPACPDRPVDLQFNGHFLDGCGRLVASGVYGSVRIVLAPYPPVPTACPAVLEPWSALVSIGLVLPGSHQALIQETVQGTNACWPPVFDEVHYGLFDFTVADSCDSIPPPGPYPFYVYVTPEIRSGLICAGSPIRVNVGGQFPNSCWSIRKVELLPHQPTDIVRVVLDNGRCREQVCPNVPTSWDTSVVLPGLPAGAYEQEAQVGIVTCSDSIPPDSLYSKVVPFFVVSAESCGVSPPVGCLLPSWTPGESNGCNAFLGLDGKAKVGLRVSTGVALSGLQGELRFLQPGLGIATIETDGPAVGMHLTWTRTETGARFVMFAEHGAPIPATSQPVPVLQVGLELLPMRHDVPWPANGFDLQAAAIFGADSEGVEVPPCPTFAFDPVIAHICFERPCDFDANGVADVRDLVRMVHCVNGDGPCPPDAATSFDCNGDALFGLDDVLCCAVHLLNGPVCPDCPIDSTRTEPSVRATFDAPVATAGGVDVPLVLMGTDRLGAARLGVRFPADRYTFAGAEAHESAWLELHEAGEGRASVGLIRVGPNIEVSSEPRLSGQSLRVVLHLVLRPGATAGGEITLDTGEFSGPDGVMLRVDLAAEARSLDGRAALAITGVRPNPSDGEFRISLSLTAPAPLDVAVLDLAGRRVASLFHGDRAAGSHTFVWDGRTSDGAPAHGGVYFVRAAVGGRTAVKKLILLGTRGGYRILPASP